MTEPVLSLGGGALDQMMPMHLIVDQTGHIRHAGPTFMKLQPGRSLVGLRLLEVLELKRPRRVMSMDELAALAGGVLHFILRTEPHTRLTGILVPLSEGNGVLLNLSFGIAVIDAVRDYDLTNVDFAPTDLTVEMLYLVEAKSAAMKESRKLNARLQGAKVAAEEQAFTDTLTGLKNRRAMDHILGRMILSGTDFSLMQLDLDYFKLVNDTMGHAAGDHVLQKAAQIMVQASRVDDTVARVGGDEFVLIFQGLTKKKRLLEIARKLIAALEKPIQFNGRSCRISGSIGISISNGYDLPSAEQMMKDADLALYASKNRGRALATVYCEKLLQTPDLTAPPSSAGGPTVFF